MKIKTVYERLKPELKKILNKSAKDYSSAKRLKYTLMSKTSWSDLKVDDIQKVNIYCNISTWPGGAHHINNMSASEVLYGNAYLID
tara:strand:- start:399 stop:656 length:258 start_codon:yes stop_codon:yes gene_type:complete